MAILADVAPYSREYHNVRQRIAQQAQGDTELEIEYEKIMNWVKQTRESVIRMNDRHFTAPVDEISGTVNEVSAGGVTLNEYPGRRFQFSSVGMSAADLSARILGEKNDMTRCFRPARHKTPRAPAPEAASTRLFAVTRLLAACPEPFCLPLRFSCKRLHFSLVSRSVILYARGREVCIFTRVLVLMTHFAGYSRDKPPIVTHGQSE
jgi:hypothetical protein